MISAGVVRNSKKLNSSAGQIKLTSSTRQRSTCLNVGVEDTLVSLDPDSWASLTDIQIGRQVYQGLVDYDCRMNIIPAIAESWQASADGKDWRFTVRSPINFHDGAKCDAEAVVWNLEHRLAWRTDLGTFIKDISIASPNSFTIRLKKSYAPLLDLLAGPAAVLVSPASEKGRKRTGGSGTGPFQFHRNGSNGSILLKRRDNAPGGEIDQIRFITKADGMAMWMALRNEELDLIYECPYAVIKDLSLGKNIVRKHCPSLSVNMLHFNMSALPFDEISARRQVAAAIDKQELFEKANESLGCVAEGPISPASWFYTPNRNSEHKNRQRHRKISFELLTTLDFNPTWLELFQEQMSRAGVQCRLRLCSFREVLTRLRSRNYQSALMGMGGTGDPDQLLYGAFHSSGAANVSGICDSQLDDLLERAREKINPEQRKALYAEALDLIARICPAVFLRHGLSMAVHSSALEGIEVYPDSFLRLGNAVLS